MAENPFIKFSPAKENPFAKFSAPEPVDYQQQMIEEMSVPERMLVGAGRGFATTGQGLKQLALKAGESMGVVTPDEVESYRQKIAEEKSLYDPLAEQSTATGLGELVGTIAATAPTMLIPGGAATSLGARTTSAAAGGAAGAASQPVYEGDFAEEKLSQAAEGALFAAGATYGLDKLRDFMPRNLLSKLSQKGFDRDTNVTKQGELLSTLTGIDMTPAQISESKALSFLENAARQSIFTADELAKNDQKVAKQAVKSISNLASKISQKEKGAETVGAGIQDAVKTAVNDAVKLRRVQANADYGVAENLSGGSHVIKQGNYLDELNSILDDFSGVDSIVAQMIVK